MILVKFGPYQVGQLYGEKVQKWSKMAKSGVTSNLNISFKTIGTKNIITYLESQINCLSYEYSQVTSYLHPFTYKNDVEVGQNTKKCDLGENGCEW